METTFGVNQLISIDTRLFESLAQRIDTLQNWYELTVIDCVKELLQSHIYRIQIFLRYVAGTFTQCLMALRRGRNP